MNDNTDLIVACPECDSAGVKCNVCTDMQGPNRDDTTKHRCEDCGHRFPDYEAVRRKPKVDVPPRGDSLARTLYDADPDDLATDGGRPELEFADEYVAPIIEGAKTATIRLHGPRLELNDHVTAVDEDGEEFATLKIRATAAVAAVDALTIIEVFRAEYHASTADQVLNGLRRHYDDVNPSTPVDVIVFEVVEHDDIPDRSLRADGGETGRLDEKLWRDEGLVRELYENQELSIRQTADRLGCSSSTLRYWLVNHHDIEIRSIAEGRRALSKGSRNRVPFMTSHQGYEWWRASAKSEPFDVKVHRLVAVAEYGYDAVVDKDIHHKNGIPWDNRPENLEPLAPEEHRELHSEQLRYGNRDLIADLYEYTDGSKARVADLFDISPNAVGRMHEEHHEQPPGDDTIFQGHACAHCGDRIKLDEIASEEPYVVPTNEDGDGFCSVECREQDDAGVTVEVVR